MSRHEVKRFVYLCDGLENQQKRCDGTQVIDAVTEQEADNLARSYGWSVDHRKGCLCTRTHIKYRTKELKTGAA